MHNENSSPRDHQPPRAHTTQHVLVALLHDRPGVMHRTVSALSRRGINVVSLATAPSNVPGVSRMCLSVHAIDASAVMRQLEQLPDIMHVTIEGTTSPRAADSARFRVVASSEDLAVIADEAHAAGARIVDLREREIVVEIAGSVARVESFLADMHVYGIAELRRSGRVASWRETTLDEAPTHFREQADGAPFEDAA